jgi:TrmH family RNA methyltransferase
MGAAAVVALPGTADLWNAKVVRSAAGAHFRLPLVHASADELLTFLADNEMPLWATAADGLPLDSTKAPPRLAIAFGNEGAGVSERIRAASARTVSLPMAAGVESLNVAVAAGITLYALRQ